MHLLQKSMKVMPFGFTYKPKTMKESYLFDMSFNNVVFSGRNTAYGAYELRRNYSKHVLVAALLAITIFTCGLGWPLLRNNAAVPVTDKRPNIPEEEGYTVIEYDPVLPQPPKQEPIQEQKAPPVEAKVKTVAFTEPKVVPNEHQGPEKDMPTKDQLKGALIGSTDQEGEIATAPNPKSTEVNNGGTGSGVGNEDANTIHDYVADMPYFEGGEAGLMRYIGKKIRYPRKAVLEQVEGVVVVSFVVNRLGKVTDATILKGLGYGTDEEALRVINSLPDWTPGRQNGKPVAVRYTLPIRFNMQR
jgi:periplasmic protein TonB